MVLLDPMTGFPRHAQRRCTLKPGWLHSCRNALRNVPRTPCACSDRNRQGGWLGKGYCDGGWGSRAPSGRTSRYTLLQWAHGPCPARRPAPSIELQGDLEGMLAPAEPTRRARHPPSTLSGADCSVVDGRVARAADNGEAHDTPLYRNYKPKRDPSSALNTPRFAAFDPAANLAAPTRHQAGALSL